MSASESPLSEQARDLFEGMTWELEYLIRQFDPSGKDSDWNDARRLVEKARREAVAQESSTTDHSGDANKMVEDHFPDVTKMTKLEAQNRELVERVKRLEETLHRIANTDYRGNRSTESQIAFEALKEAKP